jgi:hypothetical protein
MHAKNASNDSLLPQAGHNSNHLVEQLKTLNDLIVV